MMSPTLAFGKTKLPSISDIVPIVVFFTEIEAPITGVLSLALTTPKQNFIKAFEANLFP